MAFKFELTKPQMNFEEFINLLNSSGKSFSVVAPRIYSFELKKCGVKTIFFSDPRLKKRKKTLYGFKETESLTFQNFEKNDLKIFSTYETTCIHLKTIEQREPYVSQGQLSLFGSGLYYRNVNYSRVIIKNELYVVSTSDIALYTLPSH